MSRLATVLGALLYMTAASPLRADTKPSGAAAANVKAPEPSVEPVGPVAGAAVSADGSLRGHEKELSGCYAKALAVDGKRGGTIRLTLGKAPAFQSDEVGGKGFELFDSCVLDTARRWKESEGPGSATFTPPAAPSTVRIADAPLRGPVKGKMHAQILLDRANVGAPESLVLLSLEPGAELPLHVHPLSDEVIYCLRGRARIGGTDPATALDLDPGKAVYLKAGAPHSVRSIGGRGVPAVLLELYAPGGPEARLVDPGAPSGTELWRGGGASASLPVELKIGQPCVDCRVALDPPPEEVPAAGGHWLTYFPDASAAEYGTERPAQAVGPAIPFFVKAQ